MPNQPPDGVEIDVDAPEPFSQADVLPEPLINPGGGHPSPEDPEDPRRQSELEEALAKIAESMAQSGTGQTDPPRGEYKPGVLDQYISPDDLAEQLGLSRRTLDRWDAFREGPPRTKIGNKIMYRRESVLEWIRSHEGDV